MATETFRKEARPVSGDIAETDQLSLWSAVRPLLLPLASLKFTVVLFAMAILLVLFGTLAQWRKDNFDVITNYFRTLVTFVEIKDLLPASFVPELSEKCPLTLTLPGGKAVRFGFYFPGGWLIGGLMAINLLIAHTLRFKVQVRETRLWTGLSVIALGFVTTWMVIDSGSNNEELQTVAYIKWSTLWNLFLSGLMVLWGLGLYGLFQLEPKQKLQRWGLILFEILLGGLVGWLLYQGDSAQLGDSSMRILWQLLKATTAGLILLAGCTLVFKKRAGIVVLHGGIGLLMFSELLVGTSAVEGNMRIQEGETFNYSFDLRTFELAVVDTTTDPDSESHTVIPKPVFRNAFEKEKKIQHDELPFDIQVVGFFKNSNIRDLKPGEKTPADTGLGLHLTVDEAKPFTGTESETDNSSAYVKLTKKGTNESLGTYLTTLMTSPQSVVVGDKTYEVALRFQRMYKPYSVNLIDVSKNDYIGTSTPRDYRSKVRLVDEERNVDREIEIWMNNPLRYAGETFYQSSYQGPPDFQTEATVLQVVTNTGWMIPYVSCMIVAVGILSQFGLTLMRFLNRRSSLELKHADFVPHLKSSGERSKGKEAVDLIPSSSGIAVWLVPLLIVLISAGWLGSKSRVPKADKGECNLQEVRKLPVVYGGRVKPLDTLARNSLRLISGKQTFYALMDKKTFQENWDDIKADVQKKWKSLTDETLKDFDGTPADLIELVLEQQKLNESSEVVEDAKVKEFIYSIASEKQPAIRWLMDVIARPSESEKHRVFKIHNPEVLQTFGLERRKVSLYSFEDFSPGLLEFKNQVEQAAGQAAEKRSVFQKKILLLRQRLNHYFLLLGAFRPPNLPELPTQEEFENDREKATRKLVEFGSALRATKRMVKEMGSPLIVPMQPTKKENVANEDSPGVEWEAYSNSWADAYLQTKMLGQDLDPAFRSLNVLIAAYAQNDPKTFNVELENYQQYLAKNTPENVNLSKTKFETFFNQFEPFYHSSVLYVVSFVLAALAWLGWSRGFNRASLWLILFTFAVHTVALIARIYISGRPPVTNLYSSAIFIGWGCVVLGMVFEAVYRTGIGNVVSSVSGFATLLIAHLLTTSVPDFGSGGDTIAVMQAVLDTQFWLATHVVCITLGYSTTFLAGLLGVFYILRGTCTPSLTPNSGKDLVRMIYGTLCFAIFFSFVGTVLGGLWADDSWGRFWGWDTKENGALIIVLWNVLVLHARWGGMVKNRGLAVLAVGGNIVTSWSWFGVNELGVGLHSYGFTEGALFALGSFVLSQLVIIAVGSMPKKLWWSFRDQHIG
jgi:ABC-type transport system involved in cytochrome c biogenesis permease subunit